MIVLFAMLAALTAIALLGVCAGLVLAAGRSPRGSWAVRIAWLVAVETFAVGGALLVVIGHALAVYASASP